MTSLPSSLPAFGYLGVEQGVEAEVPAPQYSLTLKTCPDVLSHIE